MPVDVETRERLVAVEIELKAMQKANEKTAQQVSEMYDLLMQARGARLAVVLMWASLSAVATGLGTAWAFAKGLLPKLA